MTRLALGVLALILWAAPLSARANELEIVHVRVGQGDATLILGPADEDGSRVSVLFDAGNIRNPDGGALVLRALHQRGVSELDYFIVSHDDADHLGGAAFGPRHGSSFMLGFDNAPGDPGDDDGDGVSDWLDDEFTTPDPQELGSGDDIRVRHFIDYGAEFMRDDSDAIAKYQAFANAMGERVELNSQADVDSFEIDLGGGARMLLMAANGFVRGREEQVARVDTPNERSLSFLLRYGGFDYLISGDLIGRTAGNENARVEAAVAEALRDMGVAIDMLHVNHHGANNASDQGFLNIIRPEVAIISAGNGNSHRHPASATLNRLADAGVGHIVQTEWGSTQGAIPADVRRVQSIFQGDIIVRTDGVQYEISTSRTLEVDG